MTASSPLRIVVANVLVALAYWGVSHLVWIFFEQFGMLPAPIWPAAAIALFAALGLGFRVAPGIFVGAVSANALSLGAPPAIALGIGVMNTVGPILAASLIRRFATDLPPFGRVRDLFLFVLFGVVLHAALTALGGITSLVLGGRIPAEAAIFAGLRWWTAHAGGTLLFAPLLILWWADHRPTLVVGRPLEMTVVSLAGLLATALIFFGVAAPSHSLVGLPLLLILPLAWIAARFAARETATLLPLMVGVAALATIMGRGPFHLSGNERPMVALALMGVAFAVTALLLSALACARRKAEAESRLAANVFHHSVEGVLITDAAGVVVSVNPAFREITGYASEEVVGERPSILNSHHHDDAFFAELWGSLKREGFWQGEIWNRRKDGQVFIAYESISAVYDSDGRPVHYVSVFNDITELRRKEEHIQHMAYHDALTGLPNRVLFVERLEQGIRQARRHRDRLAVMFIDLDNFKLVNDSLGHHQGDALLRGVAERIDTTMRAADTVARQGGDEFVVMVQDMGEPEDALNIAEKIRQVLLEPFDLGGKLVTTTPSIGIAVYPEDGEESKALMRNADAAMYHAKEKGRNNVQFFTPALNAAVEERMTLLGELRQALEEGELTLHFQPICAADASRCGVEALVRWNHPEHGMIPPDRFIPIAEESGLIIELGGWVLDQACAQLARWRAAGMVVKVAVNVSVHQLHAERFVRQVAGAIECYAIDPGMLELEITESAAMDNPEHAIEQLHALRALGVELAIDDFGTGYSSLAYIKRLPVQTLKLDRTFVGDIDSDENDAAISAATVALAHNLGLKVVAEGVETEAQRGFLEEHRCDYLQGYLFSRPLPVAEATEYLRRAHP